MKEKWLVISNCQTVGLGNSLSLLCPDVEVATCDIWKFSANIEQWKTRLSDYDQLIALPEDQSAGLVDLSAYTNVTRVPGFRFRGCHPDVTYVKCGETVVKGPMDGYHSAIVLAAFKQGLTEAHTRSLFTLDFYDSAGFFSIWEAEKKELFDCFDLVDLDIRADFVRWMRSGGFMHTVNHPRINAVYDVAIHVARKLYNGALVECGIRPHDNLTVGPIYPVYPEIAEHYGLSAGSYYFKPVGTYKVITIEEFIAGSYSVYRNFTASDLLAGNSRYERAMELIAEGL